MSLPGTSNSSTTRTERVIRLDSYTNNSFAPWDRYSTPLSDSTRSPPTEEEEGYTHSLIFLLHPTNHSILLGLKLCGFGAGTYNGIGGKLNRTETARQSILRETLEEINVQLLSDQVEFVGRVKIDVEQGEKVAIAVFVTKLNPQQKKAVRGSQEIQPKFFNRTRLPWKQMRPEHKMYLSLVLDRHQEGYFHRGQDWKERIDLEVKFRPEPAENELSEGERPENHRSVKRLEA